MSPVPLRYFVPVLALLCCGFAVIGCGGKDTNTATLSKTGSVSPQLLSASSWSDLGGTDQNLTAPKSELLSQTCLTCLGMPQAPACTLHAGNAPMSFTAEPSALWFDISPISGTIAPNASMSLSVSAIYANVLSTNNNKGTIIVRAPGYADNTQLSFTLSCGINNLGLPPPDIPDPSQETCHLSVVCPPCSTNTAGNTAYTIASVSRTNGISLYQLAANTNIPAGTKIIISGIEDNSFNGTYVIASIPLPNQFVITQPFLPDAVSGTGTAYVPESVTCPW